MRAVVASVEEIKASAVVLVDKEEKEENMFKEAVRCCGPGWSGAKRGGIGGVTVRDGA